MPVPRRARPCTERADGDTAALAAGNDPVPVHAAGTGGRSRGGGDAVTNGPSEVSGTGICCPIGTTILAAPRSVPERGA